MKKWIFTALVMCLFLVGSVASADGLAHITQPTEGEVVESGFPLWLQFIPPGGSFSQYVANWMPVRITVRDNEGNLIYYNEVSKIGVLNCTATGAYYTSITFDTDVEEGDYTLTVNCPGSRDEFDSVTIHVVENLSDYVHATEPWESIPDNKNPGYYIETSKDVYTLDLAEDNCILIDFRLINETGNDHEVIYRDWISNAAGSIIKYKAMNRNGTWVDHGDYSSMDDGWIMYRALQTGTVEFHVYATDATEWKTYSERVITINVIDSAGEGAQTHRLVLPESLTVIGPEAFANDNLLDEVFVPEGCERIESRAFANCSYMDSIYIPASVEYIAEDAFDGIDSLRIFTPVGSYAQEYADTYEFRITVY